MNEMNTVLVWFLVTLGGHGGYDVIYSQPMADLASCELLQKNIRDISPTPNRPLSRCIQIRMAVSK